MSAESESWRRLGQANMERMQERIRESDRGRVVIGMSPGSKPRTREYSRGEQSELGDNHDRFVQKELRDVASKRGRR